jgi:hypothetical protein
MASELAARPRAPPFIDPPGYARHRPEATLLYRLVERHYPELVAAREAAGRPLPKYVQSAAHGEARSVHRQRQRLEALLRMESWGRFAVAISRQL